MKIQLHHLSSIVCLLLFTGGLFAQKAETPDYTYDVGGNINNMTLTLAGTMVVSTSDGLVGIKPGSNELVFKFTDYGSVKPEEVTYIPASPYLIVDQGGVGGLKALSALSSKKAVIDYISGKVIFTTESKGLKTVQTADVIMPDNKLVISGLQKEGSMAEKNTAKLAVYDLITGNLDYSFFLNEPGKTTAKYFAVTGTPLLLKDKLLVPTTQGIYAKSHSGQTLWENDVKDVNWMTSSADEKEIYAFDVNDTGSKTEIIKVKPDGGEAWGDKVKVDGVVSNFQIVPQGLIVVSDKDTSGKSVLAGRSESKINLLSAANGEDLWDKAPKTGGFVQHFYVMEDGILFGIYEGGINKVAFDGTPLFKKPLKTGENIQIMAETPKGLIYITSEDANIVDLKTGESVWNKPLKFKKAESVTSAFDEAHSRYLINADDELFAVDAASGDVSTLANVKFDEKENPTTLAVRDNGIFLGSDQNMTLLDFDGNEKYHEYYKSPGRSTFGKIMGGITAVATTTLTVAMAAKAGANRNGMDMNNLDSYNETGKEAKRAQDMFASMAGASFEYLSKRFKASAATEDSQFILSNLDDGVGLVKLSKADGSVKKEILLKDKKPEYEVDDFGGVLYYKADNKTIYAYNLR
ncbi:PQQ-binding-like beta-propeller repeat protein [Leeuwenhoekiella parthenopeia]|uniref:PQQ-like beta-propeller repeat protein n=1 Tax=Leeuwenhoekiella parthenopeia TaxID=2890320 RepID=A0ABS8GTS6_9FLAO|nr:PQQ-binding-like beta-propeller repeat protein [Leeuwenhoekiella parthenopeia]MCC4212878.1 PQQ-like beta-propeller repeat protein [Leeuwenhoekiella parthenopeia]